MTSAAPNGHPPSVRAQLTQAIAQAWQALRASDASLEDVAMVPTLGVPKQRSHGDYSTPFALALGRKLGKNPRALATQLAQSLGTAGGLLAKVEVAGAGHLNLTVHDSTWRNALWQILQAPASALRSSTGGGERILLEFVSANPTGPLHVAHGRGAVYGDVTARLLTCAGYDVTREYYINDLGHQTDVLARSIHAHYRALCGHAFVAPAEYYPGDYVKTLASSCFAKFGDALADADEATWLPQFNQAGTQEMLLRIRADLEAFNVPFDSWVSERAIAKPEVLQGVVEALRARGHIFEDADRKVWFRSTTFGDDKDRVMVREDGRPTYFLSDVAYHHEKAKRGFARLINVWGADHGGYLPRIHASLEALGYDPKLLHVCFVQMVSLSRGGEAVKMGKRLGTAVWLREVIDETGRDATRYLFSTRRLDTQMDFDIDLATKKSLENPIYYAQMGHARLCAIGRKAAEKGQPLAPVATWQRAQLDALGLEDELHLMRGMARAVDVVADAAKNLEPHQVTAYVQLLIADFHSYYSRNKTGARVIGDDAALTQARLLLCRGLQTVLATFLELLGVEAPAQMVLDEGAFEATPEGGKEPAKAPASPSADRPATEPTKKGT